MPDTRPSVEGTVLREAVWTREAVWRERGACKGLDPQIAFSEIVKYRGTQFDGAVVDAFVKAFDTGPIKKRTKDST